MRLAIPGKVVEFDDKSKNVVISYFGELKKAINEIKDLKLGDFVYAQGGFVIEKVDQQEAENILETWKDLFFELQERDTAITRLTSKPSDTNDTDKKLTIILDKAIENKVALDVYYEKLHPNPPLVKRREQEEELEYLLKLQKPSSVELLMKTANFIRQKYQKNACCVHGIIEISNYCERNCLYCGIAVQCENVQRYRMTKDEIVEAACEAAEKYGFRALVLQSGEDAKYSVDELADIIQTIKQKIPVLIAISFGEIGIDGLKKLYDAGARAILMRFETSNVELYAKLHPGYSLDTRLEHLREAFKIGYLVITGSLIGLPGQTESDIVNDMLLCKELHADMVSIGPVLANPNQRLKLENKINEELVLKTLALARLIDPENAKILVTTGFETLSKNAREKGLMSGANSLMLNVTPERFKKEFVIYPNRANIDRNLVEQIEETQELLQKLGRSPMDV